MSVKSGADVNLAKNRRLRFPNFFLKFFFSNKIWRTQVLYVGPLIHLIGWIPHLHDFSGPTPANANLRTFLTHVLARYTYLWDQTYDPASNVDTLIYFYLFLFIYFILLPNIQFILSSQIIQSRAV